MRSTSPRPPEAPLLLDEGLGTTVIAEALRAAGAQVILHRDHFAPGTADEDWLRVAGENGWIVLGKDRAIRRRQVEVEAVISAGVRLFTLTSANMSGEEMAQAFVRALPRMTRMSASRTGAFMFIGMGRWCCCAEDDRLKAEVH